MDEEGNGWTNNVSVKFSYGLLRWKEGKKGEIYLKFWRRKRKKQTLKFHRQKERKRMDEEGSVDELMASKKIHIIPLDEKRGKKRGEKTTKSKIWRMEKKKSKKK